MYYTIKNSLFGQWIVVGNKEGITQLLIDNGHREISIDESWQRDDDFFDGVITQLDEYASGQRQQFKCRINPAGSDFQQKVWQALMTIPYGQTQTYQQIATAIGNPKAARAVGMANQRNPIPIIIPCHRVIGADGSLTGYAYGLAMKEQLLTLESD